MRHDVERRRRAGEVYVVAAGPAAQSDALRRWAPQTCLAVEGGDYGAAFAALSRAIDVLRLPQRPDAAAFAAAVTGRGRSVGPPALGLAARFGSVGGGPETTLQAAGDRAARPQTRPPEAAAAGEGDQAAQAPAAPYVSVADRPLPPIVYRRGRNERLRRWTLAVLTLSLALSFAAIWMGRPEWIVLVVVLGAVAVVGVLYLVRDRT